METPKYKNYRIEAENICVDYHGKVALYDANLRLKAGQICGLVGMNGAGKTTTFRMMCGIEVPAQHPDSEIWICGLFRSCGRRPGSSKIWKS